MSCFTYINKVFGIAGRLLSVGLSGLFLLSACDEVDEAERLIYEKPAEAKRCVLIEDFTGQRCINCPTATLEIEKLQQQYGADTVIAVAIHSGPFAHRTSMSSPLLPLGTELGDQYYQHWGIEAQPAVMINRGTPIYDPSKYAAAVNAELQKSTPLNISVKTTLEGKQLKVEITNQCTESLSAKLQIWLTENNIVNTQFMPDGSSNNQYVHNHVFRASLTGDPYGLSFNMTGNGMYSVSQWTSIELDDSWKPENLNIVAFAYNDTEGVLQAVTCPVISTE